MVFDLFYTLQFGKLVFFHYLCNENIITRQYEQIFFYPVSMLVH